MELFACDNDGGTWSKKTGISNGDHIVYTWDMVNPDILKEKYHIVFDYDDININVTDLKDIETFDAFEGIELTYDGYSSKAVLSLSKENVLFPELPYSASKAQLISNGDVITVRISSSISNTDTLDYCVERFGKIPESLTKEYYVDCLPELLKDVNNLSQDSIEAIGKASILAINEWIDEHFYEGLETMQALEPVEMYLVIPSEYSLTAIRIYDVYKITVANTEDELSYYIYVAYEKPTVMNDGSITELSNPVFPEGSCVFGFCSGEAFLGSSGKYYYLGYETLSDLENKLLYAPTYVSQKIR